MSLYAQINARGDVSRGLIPPTAIADTLYTQVRLTSNATLAGGVDVTWQAADTNNGAWSVGDPTHLVVTGNVGDEVSFGCQISADFSSTTTGSILFNNSGTATMVSFASLALSLGLAGIFHFTGSGGIYSWSWDMKFLTAGTCIMALQFSTEGVLPRTIEAARSRFWVVKLR